MIWYLKHNANEGIISLVLVGVCKLMEKESNVDYVQSFYSMQPDSQRIMQ
jgi:hypothetical protein